MARPEICAQYGHTLAPNHQCLNCQHRVCRWCYVDEKQIRAGARETGTKPNLNGPPDIAAVRFHERRAAQAKTAKRTDVELPEIVTPAKKRVRKSKVVPSMNVGWPAISGWPRFVAAVGFGMPGPQR